MKARAASVAHLVVELNEITSADVGPDANEDLRFAMRAHIDHDLSTAEIFYRRIAKSHPESNFVKYVLAHLLYDRRAHLDEALGLMHAVCTLEPENVSFHLLQGKICNELGLWDRAIDSFRSVVAEMPRLPDAYTNLKQPMFASGRTPELVEMLDAVQQRYPEIELGRYAGFGEDQRKAIARNIPSVLLVTMPKSGSVYTAARLSDELAAPLCRISLDLNPHDHVVASWAALFAKGGAVCQEHLDATGENLKALAMSGITRLQVHVRDPRQATLSWVHHIETMVGDQAYLRDLVSPALPDDYATLTFSEKINWNIDNHLPALTNWTAQWVRAAADNRHGIVMRFSCYEDFRTNQACLSGLHPHPHPLGLEWAQTGYRGARHGCSRPRRSPIPAFATRVPATFPR